MQCSFFCCEIFNRIYQVLVKQGYQEWLSDMDEIVT